MAVPKMKALRRASRPAGVPPNNIPAPYPRLPRTTISLFLLLTRQQPSVTIGYTNPVGPPGYFYIYYEDMRENAGEGKIANRQKRRRKREKDRWPSLLCGA